MLKKRFLLEYSLYLVDKNWSLARTFGFLFSYDHFQQGISMFSHIHPDNYQQQLDEKQQSISNTFAQFDLPTFEIYPSPTLHYRQRAEFRVWHDGDDLYYIMFNSETKEKFKVEDFPVASVLINQFMTALLADIRNNEILRQRLFQVDFLSTLSGEVLISLLYHKQLDEQWIDQAQQSETELLVAKQKAEEHIKAAKGQANQIVADAKENADAQIANASNAAQTEAANILKNADAQIEKNKAQMEKELFEKTAGLVALGVEKILEEDVNQERNQSLNKRALDILKNK